MRIAILVPNFAEYSGDARVVELQARELAERGNYVAIFTLTADIKPKDTDLFILGAPKKLFLQRVYRLFLPFNFFIMLQWLPKLKKFDLIIAHLYPMTWLAYLAKKFYKVHYIFWFHGIEDPRLFPKIYERIYMNLHIILTKITTQNVDRAISVSFFAKRKLEEYTGLQSKVVYNKVDPQRFYKGLNKSKVRKKYNLDDDPVILYVGRLAPQKGVHLLIKAFKLIKNKITNAWLVVVGDPTFYYYFEELKAISDDSIIFTGHISSEEIPYYYAMCDVYATCSLWENHNLPVLEAQACGKPVVAFEIEAFKEAVNDNGILIEKGNIEEFARACIEKIKQFRYITRGYV